MRIVIDTNVLISGVFFGGSPKKVISAVIHKNITACATDEIIDEYNEIVQEMISGKQGHLNTDILAPLIGAMDIIGSKTKVKMSRDPDDDKFLECAKETNAVVMTENRPLSRFYPHG